MLAASSEVSGLFDENDVFKWEQTKKIVALINEGESRDQKECRRSQAFVRRKESAVTLA